MGAGELRAEKSLSGWGTPIDGALMSQTRRRVAFSNRNRPVSRPFIRPTRCPEFATLPAGARCHCATSRLSRSLPIHTLSTPPLAAKMRMAFGALNAIDKTT